MYEKVTGHFKKHRHVVWCYDSVLSSFRCGFDVEVQLNVHAPRRLRCSPCAHPVQAFLESPDGKRWCRDASRGAVHALQLAMQLAQARYRRLQRRLRKATWSEYNRMSHVCDKGRRRAKLLRKRAELKRKAEGIDPEMLDMRFEILNKRRDVGYVAGGVWRQ